MPGMHLHERQPDSHPRPPVPVSGAAAGAAIPAGSVPDGAGRRTGRTDWSRTPCTPP